MRFGYVQLPALQLRQQRVAQGGEGAGLVEAGVDLLKQRRHLLIKGKQDLRIENSAHGANRVVPASAE